MFGLVARNLEEQTKRKVLPERPQKVQQEKPQNTEHGAEGHCEAGRGFEGEHTKPEALATLAFSAHSTGLLLERSKVYPKMVGHLHPDPPESEICRKQVNQHLPAMPP